MPSECDYLGWAEGKTSSVDHHNMAPKWLCCSSESFFLLWTGEDTTSTSSICSLLAIERRQWVMWCWDTDTIEIYCRCTKNLPEECWCCRRLPAKTERVLLVKAARMDCGIRCAKVLVKVTLNQEWLFVIRKSQEQKRSELRGGRKNPVLPVTSSVSVTKLETKCVQLRADLYFQ